jgi:hypothetical protein
MTKRGPRVLAGLPATLEQAEMALLKRDSILFAQDQIRMSKDGRIKFGPPLSGLTPTVSPFDRAGGGKAKIEILKDMALRDPEFMLELFDLGRAGVPFADQTMRALILIFEHRNLPKPPPLSTYTELLAAGRIRLRRGHGPEKGDTTLRDVVFTFIVGSVCERFGLRPTRLQAASKRLSGCFIVALASQEEKPAMSEPAIVEAWRRYGRAARALMEPLWTFASD